MAASATQNPMPDVPPKTRTRVSRSFEVYLAGGMVLMKRRLLIMLLLTRLGLGTLSKVAKPILIVCCGALVLKAHLTNVKYLGRSTCPAGTRKAGVYPVLGETLTGPPQRHLDFITGTLTETLKYDGLVSFSDSLSLQLRAKRVFLSRSILVQVHGVQSCHISPAFRCSSMGALVLLHYCTSPDEKSLAPQCGALCARDTIASTKLMMHNVSFFHCDSSFLLTLLGASPTASVSLPCFLTTTWKGLRSLPSFGAPLFSYYSLFSAMS